MQDDNKIFCEKENYANWTNLKEKTIIAIVKQQSILFWTLIMFNQNIYKICQNKTPTILLRYDSFFFLNVRQGVYYASLTMVNYVFSNSFSGWKRTTKNKSLKVAYVRNNDVRSTLVLIITSVHITWKEEHKNEEKNK